MNGRGTVVHKTNAEQCWGTVLRMSQNYNCKEKHVMCHRLMAQCLLLQALLGIE
jgi:hypothetical protein